jgi:hypothetical protein
MIKRRTMIAAMAGLLLATAAPAVAADTASPDDTARFLAGMAPAADSPLAAFTRDGSWQQHAKSFDTGFQRVDNTQLSRIRNWSSKNVTAPSPTVFYFFSGPDFLYANAFYPKAKTYVMAGLEPVGNVPDLTTMRGSIGGELARLRGSLSSVMSYSFFITKNMKSDLRAGRINGALPILYVFLARSGYSIREVTPVSVDAEGNLKSGSDAARSGPAPGIKIVFAGSDGEPKTLYYFSTNLADDGVKNSNFLKFCATLAPGDGLIKSASYLLHSGGFNRVRDFLLANDTTMIQDDSGIPLTYYNPQTWDLQPFGRYLGPISIFPGRHQQKYVELFKKSRPIDFGIGYRHRPSESNLLLAVRKTPVAKDQAESSDTTTASADPVAATAPAEAAKPKKKKTRSAPRNSAWQWPGFTPYRR